MRKTLIPFIPLCFFSLLVKAQQWNLPLNQEANLTVEQKVNQLDVPVFTNLKPYNIASVRPYYNYDSTNYAPKQKGRWLYRKLKKESLFIIDTTDFHVTIDPLFNFELGRDTQDTSGETLYKNTRGFLIRGDIGKKLSFESSFYENQATFPQYVDDFIKIYNVVPGEGRVKAFKKTGYDFAMAAGNITYAPCQHYNVQFGTGKNFIGDGYRSLLLSDNAFNYPYLRSVISYGKLQYTNLYTLFMNIGDTEAVKSQGTERLFQRKAGSFQLLDWNACKRLQLGFFQGMIWRASDSLNRQHYNFNYFDPVIFVNTFIYGLHNTNNMLLGATFKAKVTDYINVYGQWALDDWPSGSSSRSIANKSGYQLGLKMFNVGGIRNLYLQAEYNRVRPYMYASMNPEQNYSHYNQPLADPLGANFQEAIGCVHYVFHDFFINYRADYALLGSDTAGINFGGDIFKSDHSGLLPNSNGYQMGQGLQSTLFMNNVQVGYLINPVTNMNIFVGIENRSYSNKVENFSTNYIYFGIKTSLSNVYYDF